MIRWRHWKREHAEFVTELQKQERRIVEMTRRLIRIEAELGIVEGRAQEGDE